MMMIDFNGKKNIGSMLILKMKTMLKMIKTPMAATPSDSACVVSSMVSLKLQPDT